MNNGSIVVGGHLIVLDGSTEIRGHLAEGALVRARGVISSNGTYLATRVEVQSSGGGRELADGYPHTLVGRWWRRGLADDHAYTFVGGRWRRRRRWW